MLSYSFPRSLFARKMKHINGLTSKLTVNVMIKITLLTNYSLKQYLFVCICNNSTTTFSKSTTFATLTLHGALSSNWIFRDATFSVWQAALKGSPAFTTATGKREVRQAISEVEIWSKGNFSQEWDIVSRMHAMRVVTGKRLITKGGTNRYKT